MSALRELLASFKIDIDDKKLEDFNKKLEGGVEKVKQLAEVIGAGLFGEAVKEFVEGQVEIATQLKLTSERLGLSTEEIQKWNLAANMSGVSSEEMAVGLRFLNRNIGEAVSGSGTATDTFRKLHIAVKNADGSVRPLADITGELADKIKDAKSQAERTKIAMDLLGRGGAALLPLFQEGKEGIDEAFEAFEQFGGGVPKEFIENSKKMERETVKMKFAFEGIKARVANELLPVFLRTVERAGRMAASFIKVAKETNILKTATIALTVGAFVLMTKKIWDVVGGLKGLFTTLRTFGPIVVLAAALYLIFDDLFTLFTGGNSVIGQVIDHLYGVGAAQAFVQELTDAWNELLAAFGLTGEATDKALGKKSGGLTFWIESAVDAVLFLVDIVVTLGRVVAQMARGFGDIAKGDFKGAAKEFGSSWKTELDGVKEALGDLTEGKIGTKRGGGLSQAQLEAGTGGTGLFTQNGQFMSASIPQAGPQTVTQKNDIKVDINGGNGSARQIGDAARRGVQEALGTTDLRSAFGSVGTGT